MSSLLAHVESVWQAVVPLLPGFTVEVLPSVDSTNSELMRRARSGPLQPTLLAALEQTAGRGRMGKGWHSEAGRSLTFSVALPLAPADWSGLSLAVGVSLAESLHPEVALKWPNDLWLARRKLGGILVETAGPLAPPGAVPAAAAAAVGAGPAAAAGAASRLVVVGVGINLARPDAQAVAATAAGAGAGTGAGWCAGAGAGAGAGADFAAADQLPAVPPAGLEEWLPGVSDGEVLQRVAPALLRDLLRFEADGLAGFLSRYAGRDALKGQAVRLSGGAEGVADGVSGNGALRVLTATGLLEVSSAEVSVRPC